MLQNKRLFTFVAIASVLIATTGVILIATKNTAIPHGTAIPNSTYLASVPPQTGELPDTTSTIASLPLDVSYTQTRDIQDTIGYLIGGKRGANYAGSYRTGSRNLDGSGSISFLVDIPTAKMTFIVRDNSLVDCAAASDQKEPDWNCTQPGGAE